MLRLSACEIMGSATTICTHKTGTLTSNLVGHCAVYFTIFFVSLIPSTAAAACTTISCACIIYFPIVESNWVFFEIQ